MKTLKEYDSMIKGADSYLKSAQSAYHKDSKFTNELIFNILTMAIENFLVGLLMSKGVMPMNHVIKYLLEETEKHFNLDTTIQKHLSMVDDYLYICSMEEFTKKVPEGEDMKNIISATAKLKEFVHANTFLV